MNVSIIESARFFYDDDVLSNLSLQTHYIHSRLTIISLYYKKYTLGVIQKISQLLRWISVLAVLLLGITVVFHPVLAVSLLAAIVAKKGFELAGEIEKK